MIDNASTCKNCVSSIYADNSSARKLINNLTLRVKFRLSGVQATIDDGLTLEQTVKKVTIPEFGGYALFGWVHPSMNIPAAYKDLSK